MHAKTLPQHRNLTQILRFITNVIVINRKKIMEMFETPELTIVQLIQFMLAPAVMISACGLLLLGINNKYSIVVNRIRLLNEERRKTTKKIGGENYETADNVRLESIIKQLGLLLYRVKLVRNAVLSYTIAVALFVLSSLLIGLAFFTKNVDFDFIILGSFLIGMIAVFAGISFTMWETARGYQIVKYEVEVDE